MSYDLRKLVARRLLIFAYDFPFFATGKHRPPDDRHQYDQRQ